MDDIDVKLLEIQKIVDRRGPPPSPSGAWFSLHAEDPRFSRGYEISGGGYSRQHVEWKRDEQRDTLSNAKNIVFDGMPGGVISHFGIWDDPQAGHLLCAGTFDFSRTLKAGDTLCIQVGQFSTDVRLDLFTGDPRRRYP